MPEIKQMMLFSLILMRMSGFILLNPIWGRKNIPTQVKGGMIMVFTLLIYSFSSAQVPEPVNSIEFAVLLLKEFAVGFTIGFVMELFLMVITFAGTIMDFQMGLSMAMIYDPQTNAQIALTGTLYQAYFILLFFAVNGHLALFKLLIKSAEIVPYGQVALGSRAAWAMLEIFTQCITMAVKFAFPLIAIEFITEIAVGVLMKIIPQINVFVVNIQAKIVIGLIMLIFLFSPMTDYVSGVINQMLLTIQDIIRLL
ncbi:flagellar biosynthetic protein FliR [Lacrimispora celerecrescens]|uniref:Flagellar biosynthetic protein FliR n=1 Tax=Lacrimispora celerecrescens TaxID=29354 RepID=A0A084JGM0_9FIRM|nr:flagellar biosynthetic protein FliR [Lacrimispora celerecrescens]KEZ88104.1 flagellar biosynthesis protein FliR [Lacrimispora celerecrescens]MBW4844692.1 flagellar biosynthetic protein FliR [Lachnospiraceae bacterium]